MSSMILPSVPQTTTSKPQRIMIITADESIIDQIEKNKNISLLKEITLPSESHDNEKSDQQNKTQSSQKKYKPKDTSLICVICGSPANGYNFGAIACESCKAFFRRNARKDPSSLHCTGQGNCEITSVTRRFCPSCRLTKCFNNGMQCDRIWTTEQKAEKRRRIEENKKLASNTNTQINEEDLQLSLSPCSQNLSISMDTDVLLTDFSEFILPQSQQTLLNSDDLQRLEAISYSYQNRIEFAARDGLPWDPSMHTNTFTQVLNSHSVQVMRLLSFFRQIPEFNQLNVDDKVTLIKYNLNTLLGINCALTYRTDTRQLVETNSDAPSNLQFYPILHGYKTCLHSRQIFLSLSNLAKYDPKIIELILIILLLTKGFAITSDYDEQILNDPSSVYRVHIYYTELLWKYMETTYEYKKAISLFSELIAHVISWQTVHEEMRNNVLRTLSPDDTNELLPIMKSVLRIS